MGFKLTPRVAVLTFEEPFEGLEIRCRHDMPADAYFKFLADVETLQATEGDQATYRAAMQMFVDDIALGWNAEDEAGASIPLTVDALVGTIPVALGMAVIPKWKESMTGVSAPLVPPSPNGNSSAEPPPATGA